MTSVGRWHLHEQVGDDAATNWFRVTEGGPTGEIAILRRLHHFASEPFVHDEIALRKKLLAVPGLTRLIDSGEVDGFPWLVQEWVEGRTLQQVLFHCHHRRVPIPMHLSVFVMTQVARHLDGLHHAVDERGPLAVVHRDVCPDVIHLGFDGLVRIPSLLWAHSRLSRAKTAPGDVVGRYSYMSPEQAHADRLDHLSDQFAVGIVLYELVCGVRPYRGRSDVEIHQAARSGDFARPRSHNRNIPEELEEAILQAMHRDPARRFDTCGQLAEELEELGGMLEDPQSATTLVGFLQRLEGAVAS